MPPLPTATAAAAARPRSPAVMPELPEVEGARRLAEREVVGKRVDKAVVADDTSAWLLRESARRCSALLPPLPATAFQPSACTHR